MRVDFPHTLFFDITSASEKVYVGNEDGKIVTHRDLSLVVRADHYSSIHLENGDSLSKHDITISLSTRWKNSTDLEKGILNNDETGFLFYSDDNDKIYIHGTAVWPGDRFIEGLGQPDTNGYLSLTIANQSGVAEYAPSIVWGSGRNNILRICSMELSVRWKKADI